MTSIILHQWEPSPFCNKVRLALNYKGINYTKINYNGFTAIKVKQLSSAATFPVLEIDGELIVDSRLIIERLDAMFPEKPITPRDKVLNAKAIILQDWVDESILPYELYLRAMYPDAMNKVMDVLSEGRPAYEKPLLKIYTQFLLKSTVKKSGMTKESKHTIETRFLELIKQLDILFENQTYMVGDTISIADFSLAGQLNEVLRSSHLKDKLLAMPHLAQWLKLIEQG